MEQRVTTRLVWSKPWYRSRGVWGSIFATIGTVYGLWATALPCGPIQTAHGYASAAVALYGSYLAFIGRKTASHPIHFLSQRRSMIVW
jgi:hypothetical protein